MKIFLTGGAGYIGSRAARILLEAGHQVAVYDSLITGYRAAVPESARFIQGDLANPQDIEAALKTDSYEAVMHFAAFIEAGESMIDPPKFYHNNLGNSVNLIDAAVKAGIQKFVLFLHRRGLPVQRPASQRGVPPGSGERLRPHQADDRGGLGVLPPYPRHTFRRPALLQRSRGRPGPGRSPPARIAPDPPACSRSRSGQREEIKIYGTDYPTPDGTCIRDYIHINDLVSAHLLALEALDNKDKLVYNLGNGVGYSVREVIETARKVTGHPIPAEETPRRPGDSPRLVASSEKIRQELGWEPQIPALADIIESAWRWHQSHPKGYE